MTKADEIRSLAAKGLKVSEIALKVGVRYQHAYNVLKRSSAMPDPRSPKDLKNKPPLHAQTLLDAGFQHVAAWQIDPAGLLLLSAALPKDVGVYAFVKDGLAMYVGVATMGLAKRIRFYAKPGITQRTSLRLNEILRRELQSAAHIDILVAHPQDAAWNGLPVHGAAGLELGLIKAYALPWNMRSAK